MASRTRQSRGNRGLVASEEHVADALKVCINAVRSLAVPARRRVIRGLHAWIFADEIDENEGPQGMGP